MIPINVALSENLECICIQKKLIMRALDRSRVLKENSPYSCQINHFSLTILNFFILSNKIKFHINERFEAVDKIETVGSNYIVAVSVQTNQVLLRG